MVQIKTAKKDGTPADNRVKGSLTEGAGEKSGIVKRELGLFKNEIKEAEAAAMSLQAKSGKQRRFISESPNSETLKKLEESLEKIRSENDSLLACVNELYSQIDDLHDENDELKSREEQDKEILKRGEQERGLLIDRLGGALSELDFVKLDKSNLVCKLDKAQEKIEELEEVLESRIETIT